MALHREFDGLIDQSDNKHPDPSERERKFLSRALAALAARKVSGYDSREVVEFLVDGHGDQGIDAVVPLNGGLHLCFIQSKWSDKGTAGFGSRDAQAFFSGFQLIEECRFDRFNEALRRYVEQIKKAPWDPQSKVTFLIVLMGDDKLHLNVERDLKDFEDRLNNFDPAFITHEVWGAKHLWEIIRDDLSAPRVDLVAPMDQWFHLGDPYDGYQGRVSAAEVADWYDQNRERLFEQNIRRPLGLTEVNQGLVQTLIEAPETFWYRNNGITILCETIDTHVWNKAAYGPIKLELHDASVVNGAQTAMATYEASRNDRAAVARAFVNVKVISTKGCPPDFATMVTRATNTQNRVGRRELVVALDSVQREIQDDFKLVLDREYVFKAGEEEPTAQVGCTVEEAAAALACAHSNPDFAVRAKRSTELLWEGSTYARLFAGPPTARFIWHVIQVHRSVRTWLYETRHLRTGRAQVVADQGDALVAHVVLQHIGVELMESVCDAEWEEVLAKVPNVADETLHWLITDIDEFHGEGSLISFTLTNAERYHVLAELIAVNLETGMEAPALSERYRPVVPRRPRRPNAIPTLVDASAIEDGTLLTLVKGSRAEREALGAWLDADERRSSATWVNDRSGPLLWAADGRRYSPTGLVRRIWDDAGWTGHPVAVQGPSRWQVPGKGTLWDLALRVLEERETSEE